MTTDELAEVLARTAFCPDCHRLMEVTGTLKVLEENVPVEWLCHYCDGEFTNKVPEHLAACKETNS